ncbi:MAG: 50S ribosomal protein L25 [Patescibacteria group bacterium]|nr:50S ribosomal protein L25 [Patescibacteria group bacterium]
MRSGMRVFFVLAKRWQIRILLRMLALEITSRTAAESPEHLRKRGVIPAVYYGPKEGATPIGVDARKLERMWREAGETTIITLKGVGDDKDTLIHDVQFHPVTGALLHADFYVLEKGKKIKISIPLEFEGSAPAEKEGHIIVKAMHEVEIEVAPQELPQHLSVDLGTLANVGDHILVSDIALPGSATLITSADDIVASVTEFKEETSEITPAPETEILTAKPAEGEGAAPEASAAAKDVKEKKE